MLPLASADWLTLAVGVLGVIAGLAATLAGLWFQGRLERTKSRRDVVGTFVASEAGAIKAVAYAVGRPDEKKGFEHLEAARERIGRLAEASHAEAFQTLS